MTEIPNTLMEAGAKLRAHELSSVELTTAVLARADQFDERLGVYLVRFDEQALTAAALADSERAAGIDRGPLHGIPIAVKDMLAAKEGPTTAQSLILDRTWGNGKDAPSISRLRRAGAVITGKVTLNEFGMGLPDATKPFPIPRNPWDLRTWPGGSSSGTASGIAAGMFLAGIGTDTAGSIRLPAAYCGVTGIKPTFGLVSKSGCVPLAYSLDHVGPLARSARDCAAMLSVLAGYEPSDLNSARIAVPNYLGELGGSLDGIRVGVEREHHFPPDADPALSDCFEATVRALKDLGAKVAEVKLPYFREVNEATMLTMVAEALAYHRQDLTSRWDDYSVGARVSFARGAFISGADYVQAQRLRRVAQHALHDLFEEVDVILTPTVATGAIAYDEDDKLIDLDTLLDRIFTQYWNAVGNPALAVPMGFTRSKLPLSLQIAGRPFDDSLVLKVGDAYQRITNWHRQVPTSIAETRPSGPNEASRSSRMLNESIGKGGKIVKTMLSAAGLPATEEEVQDLSKGYPLYKTGIDSLYAVSETRYESPALIFDPNPHFAAWDEPSSTDLADTRL